MGQFIQALPHTHTLRLEEGRGLKFDLEWERAYALSYILFICGDQVDFWSSLDWPRYVEYIEELRKESSAHEAWPVLIHAVHRVCSVRLSIQQDLVSLVLAPETPEYAVHLALGMTPSPPSLPPCLPSPPPSVLPSGCMVLPQTFLSVLSAQDSEHGLGTRTSATRACDL